MEIRKRFDFNDPVLMQLENITPKKVLGENQPASLISFINVFPRIKQNNQNIDTRWRIFSVVEFDSELRTLLLNLSVEDFWIKPKTYEKDGEYPFKDVSNFFLIVLSLPQSNVSPERIFSNINLIKTKQRNCLNTKTLNGILSAKELTKKSECHHIDITKTMLGMVNSNMHDHKTTRLKIVFNLLKTENNCLFIVYFIYNIFILFYFTCM